MDTGKDKTHKGSKRMVADLTATSSRTMSLQNGSMANQNLFDVSFFGKTTLATSGFGCKPLIYAFGKTMCFVLFLGPLLSPFLRLNNICKVKLLI